MVAIKDHITFVLKRWILLSIIFISTTTIAQENTETAEDTYKKRVLENVELDIISSYYEQDGDNAAVSGGIGNEFLQDYTGAIVISIPLSDDNVLTIDAGISAYTSASSSNVDPFDDVHPADPFLSSSGASKRDNWINVTASYSHSSDDRNEIFSAHTSWSNEYDYSSFGIGGGFTKLFNEKNTELNFSANAYFDSWRRIYPVELRGAGNGDDDDDFNINNYTITGNANYAPIFNSLKGNTRNSYSLGLGLSQILSKKLQGSLALDVVLQDGRLSTPFQRVYFADVEDSFIENFHLADDIEQLPGSRTKVALGGRLNYYMNEVVSLRMFYRYYFDDWDITSHTASIEVPVKISRKFTFYPSYRFYNQSAAKYFKPYNQHLSSDEFYSSDYDLSKYNANQYGFGVSYTDIFTKLNIGPFGLKSIDLKYYGYERNTSFKSSLFTFGLKFVGGN